MREKNYDKLYEYVNRIIKSRDGSLLYAFNRYVDTYLVHVAEPEIYATVKKMIRDRMPHENSNDSPSQE